MSTGAVEAVEPGIKPANIVDNVNDKTPDPETPPVVEEVPDPPRPDHGGIDALQQEVKALGTAVGSLTELVTSTVAARDATPARLPWTHRGKANQ